MRTTNVRERSLEAYAVIGEDGSAATKRAKVLAYLVKHPGSSRQDISRGAGIAINSVCGRVNELIECDPPLIRERGEKIDPWSGKRVAKLELVPTQGALGLDAS